MEESRVVITGLGIYSSIGKDKESVYDSIINSRSGISEISEFITDGFRNSKGGIIKNIDDIKTFTGSRSSILFNHSVEQAIKDSKLFKSNFDLTRTFISVGSSLGGMDCFVDWLFLCYNQNEYNTTLNSRMNISQLDSVLFIPGILLAKEIALKYQFSGGLSTSITACSASANAIVKAVDNIRGGISDVVIVGFVEPLSILSFMGFNALMAMTKTELKPLDQNRSGLLIGEGSACLILESEEHANKRNANIYAEIAGYGVSNDAYHSTQPHPNGDGAVSAMNKALQDSHFAPQDIQYINVHGTGTPLNDISEIKAIKRVFGDYASEVPISSTKSFIGHTLGASGGIEALICSLALYHGFIPPSLNFTDKIDGYEYNVVKSVIEKYDLNAVMSNSFGFGGNGVSLIFAKYS